MLFLDSDISFNPQDVIALLALDKEVSGGPYPKKAIKWKSVKKALERKPDIEAQTLEKVTGDYVFNPVKGTAQFSVTEPLEVLEIGTGCGYQAAVLSLLSDEVYSIERIRPLHDMAREKLRPFRIKNLRLIYGDGILGLPQAAPFDGIILAAAGLGIPDPLLDQLAIGGRLVAPVAKSEEEQQLVVVERVSSQRYQRTVLEEVFFVPLQSGTV
jgi:protein-L-isoaspartate(D-aspartate) O-methyltransferase